MIEACFVVPMLLMICLAVLDLGMGWSAALSTSNAARGGARVGASQGVADSADDSILRAVNSALGRNSLSEINAIVVYRTSTADGAVPAACLTPAAKSAGGVSSSSCNVYSSSDLTNVLATSTASPTDFGGPCPGTRRDRFWCAPNRDNSIGVNGAGLDYLGVYISIDHATSTKLFGATLEITDSAVMRIEPLAGNP